MVKIFKPTYKNCLTNQLNESRKSFWSECRGERLKIRERAENLPGDPERRRTGWQIFVYERACLPTGDLPKGEILTLGAYERERILCEKKIFYLKNTSPTRNSDT